MRNRWLAAGLILGTSAMFFGRAALAASADNRNPRKIAREIEPWKRKILFTTNLPAQFACRVTRSGRLDQIYNRQREDGRVSI